MKRIALISAFGVIALVAGTPAQEREDRTLLPQDQMTAIINEVSGERAMHNLLELVPYQRVRKPAEYNGHFKESDVMAQLAKDYGFENVTIESFAAGQAWQPTQGELWMTTPKPVKLYDVHDVALSLASLNSNGDVSGELVDIGDGSDATLATKDLTGKFALSAESVAGLGAVYTRVLAKGAIGLIGLNQIGIQRALDYPDQIVSTTANAPADKLQTAAWNVSPRTARELKGLLARGDKITIRSITRSTQVPTRSEIVHAEILGDGSTTQEVAIGGHLYEGVIKQGANDDNSGCALTLEIGRAYIKLIKEGKLPRPKRTINFQWLAEISGTRAWLEMHPDKATRIIGDLNFDMEGIRVSQSRSYWVLQRTPDSFPSYLNDIAQSAMEYIADISRERVRFRANGYLPSQAVESIRGSKDAFYIKIDKHYGSSDHVTYMQAGIPAVMFITWPDMWYHSSEDTPDKQDTTQYKRAAAVGLGSLAALASGTDEMAARILQENIGRGLSRMGENLTKGLGYMADVKSGADLNGAWREAEVAVRHQAAIEKKVVESASILYTNVEQGKQRTATFLPLIDQRMNALLDEIRAAYQLNAMQRGVVAAPPAPVTFNQRTRPSTLPAAKASPVLTAEEQAAANLIVEVVAAAAPAAGRGGGAAGGRQGGGRGGPSLPTEYNAEFSAILGRKMSVLEIRDFLSGQFSPLALSEVMAVLKAREAAGSIRLVPKAAPVVVRK